MAPRSLIHPSSSPVINHSKNPRSRWCSAVKPCPTKSSAETGARKIKKNGSGRSLAKRRSSIPEIFVRCADRSHPWRNPYARAHLRNKRGYVYLSWRDGGQVRTFYLGRAPRKCPTSAAGPGELETLPAAPASSIARRGKR